ncbi:MAG: type II secretion system protein, partial [Fervidobacterium sp.]
MRKEGKSFLRTGYTFTELLVVIILISIFFAILIAMTDSTLKAYRTTRLTLQTLYATNHIDFMFDVLENEFKWASSGSQLLKGEWGDTGLRKPDRTKFTDIVDTVNEKPWLYDSIDIQKTTNGFIVSIVYLIPSAVKFYYDSTTGVCKPLTEGYLESPDWSIVTRAISPSSEHYVPTLVKLKYYYNVGGTYKPLNNVIFVTPNMNFMIKEINLGNQAEINLQPASFPSTSPSTAPNELFITPISKLRSVGPENVYTTASFRKVSIEYNSQTKEVLLKREFPTAGLQTGAYTIKLLDSVESFQGSLVYYSQSDFSELRFDNRQDWNTYKNSAEVKNI